MPIISATEFSSISESSPFDYIIVGGGTSGLVVAARLTEDPSINVGVIEAGEYYESGSKNTKPDDIDSDIPGLTIPGLAGTAQFDRRIIWDYVSTPQIGAIGQEVWQPRGKILGGSSAVNLLAVGRGSTEEYDALEKLGNPGWNWKSLLPYFRKSETFHPPNPDFAHKYHVVPDMTSHGTNGPIHTSYPAYVWEELSDPFLESLKALGIDKNADPANGANIGTSFCTSSIDPISMTRSYAATAYYEPNAHRRNLHIVTGAVVSKILFLPSNPNGDENAEIIASGVEFLCDGHTFVVNARKEVILAAGSFKTPQLLELSGIGQKPILDKFDILQLVELRGVGENLRKFYSDNNLYLTHNTKLEDHIMVASSFEVSPGIKTLDILKDSQSSKDELNLYISKKEGQLSTLLSTFAFIPLHKFVPKEGIVKMKAMVEQSKKSNSTALVKQYELLMQWFDSDVHAQTEIFQRPHMRPGAGVPAPGKKYQTLVSSNMHPFSRGSVHISSSSPLDSPVIDPQYLSHPVDIEIMAQSVKFARRIAQTAPLSEVTLRPVFPGEDISLEDELEVWKSFVKNSIGTGYHPIGTASMLPRDDGGVVDSKLLVYGTKNVRVVDASIIPMQISHHTQATVYAIAEKAADLIKDKE